MPALCPILSFAWPIRLEFISGWQAFGLFVLLALPIVLLGRRSLGGLGPVRKWVAIGVRLAVLLLIVLLIAGIRFQSTHHNVEVLALRDVSRSTTLVTDYPSNESDPQTAVDNYLRGVAKDARKKADDSIGIISFKEKALVDAIPSKDLKLDTRGIPEPGTGTDAAAAIQLALAMMSPDAMHRLVLMWDGNATSGDLDAAIAAAAAQHVPIDVMPLHYDVQNAVMVEQFNAPAWKRENEPFSLEVFLRSTSDAPVAGTLSVLHKTEGGQQYLDMEPNTPEVDTGRRVTLQKGLNKQMVKVPPLGSAGVHQFQAVFTPDNKSDHVTAQVGAPAEGGASASARQKTLDMINAPADAFTFVRGKGQVLYVDNVVDKSGNTGAGTFLVDALAREGITLRPITVDDLPQNVVALQSYDAVILANVPKGVLSAEQDRMLATYVHDMGGGLVMIGGEQSFGAGGWHGSEVEKVLPVDMDVPAQRQVGKGALVLVMHSCEMPDGNYWGEQCGLQALKALGEQDDIGVISYAWNNGGGSRWDFPLQQRGDGTKCAAAIKNMQLGDMPSFDDSMNVALNGLNAQGSGLKDNDARYKHVIIISDGDPGAPAQGLVDQYKAAKVSVSTITVYPHMGGAAGNSALPPTMEDIAKELKGHAYGPINSKPSQLPQIFIKEATIVRRTLIHEPREGIPVKELDASDEMVKGIADFPALRGMVLTTKKNDPKVMLPLATGPMNDPVLAHWQSGLGKSAAFTGDASKIWAPEWAASSGFQKFWAQVIRGVSRPPMSSDFDIQTTTEGNKGKVVVEALNKDTGYLNFLNIAGTVVGGEDMKEQPLRLVQTGPGTYEAQFDLHGKGNYVLALNYHGEKGSNGMLLSGVAVNNDPELRALQSNESVLQKIADTTGGRVLPAWDSQDADLFTRENLSPSTSPMPIWDRLIPVLLALILVDVAVRRIAWDWAATKRFATAGADRVRSFTTVRRVETRHTLDALKRVREETGETKQAQPATSPPALPRPDPKAKFTAQGVEGDISKVVGGASDKPIPPPPKKIQPKGDQGAGGTMGSLLEAKRRAQQKMEQQKEDEKKE